MKTTKPEMPILPPLFYELTALAIVITVYINFPKLFIVNLSVAVFFLFLSIRLRIQILAIRISETEEMLASYRRFVLKLEPYKLVEFTQDLQSREALQLHDLATLYLDLKEYKKGETALRKVLSTWENSLGHEHPDIAGCLNNLANACAAQGLNVEADACYKRSIGILEKHSKSHSMLLGITLNNYAIFLREMHRSRDADLVEAILRSCQQRNGNIES